jgi:hypothetical protein
MASAPINLNSPDFMWDILQSAIQFFVPEKIEDASQKTTDIKLAAGIVFGFFLVAIAFAMLTGVGQIVIEEFGSLKITNATIFVALGAFFVWLTLTKVGIKHGSPKK